MNTALRILSLCFLLATTACMMSPYDGMRVSSRASTINFNGYNLTASSNTTIRAFNFTTNAWEDVGSATSGTSAIVLFTDSTQQFYRWGTSFVLPNAYWAPAPSGSGWYARVRAISGGFNAYTLRKDYAECWAEHRSNINEWMAECPTHRTPEAYVYTSDYQHGTCAGSPATTKTRYEVTEITPACQQAAVAGLIADYVNRVVIDQHYNIDHGTADGFFNGHRAYLKKMERWLSVYGSKWIPDGRLPYWNPATTIPSDLRTVKTSPQDCASSRDAGCTTGWNDNPLVNASPGLAKPSGIQSANICSRETFDDLYHATHHWHDDVHLAVGGAMRTFDSPAAVIFWPWHTYVDMVYAEWQACP
jgi:hypothetical protein